ncbi:GntR family transcriptional regulator [Ramlibacter sp. AW1]|uniref:GntR family transcriptional regulator n=1 Tax=Ramlibacter aurantiacus TaxID=2801330 RepID=A0A936ZQD1_9BURK|nr:GntR family transcriptional regulator [Ramlibacter aurantiacus]MBL0421645.1 GntR family transcriptional regulator [Ramlibacter aurantiacus]
MDNAARERLVSLHHQLSTLIKDGIAAGRYAPGAQLPTEESLCAEHGVSRVTVRRALESLRQQGFIEKRHGRGTFVREAPPVLALPTPIASYLDKVAQRRALSRHVLKEFGWVPASAEVRSSLQLEADAQVLRVVRLRVMGRLPLVHNTVFLPPELGRSFTRADFRSTPLSELLGRAGAHYGRIELVTRARLATPGIAQLLQVEVGSALVDVQRIGYDAGGRPIEYQQLLGPSDRFETHVTVGAAASPGESPRKGRHPPTGRGRARR